MDNEILKKVAKLGILARKQGTTKLDFNRLLTDSAYANLMLSELERCDDEELLLLCLSLKQDLGLLSNMLGNSPKPAAVTNSTRYMFSTRG